MPPSARFRHGLQLPSEEVRRQRLIDYAAQGDPERNVSPIAKDDKMWTEPVIGGEVSPVRPVGSKHPPPGGREWDGYPFSTIWGDTKPYGAGHNQQHGATHGPVRAAATNSSSQQQQPRQPQVLSTRTKPQRYPNAKLDPSEAAGLLSASAAMPFTSPTRNIHDTPAALIAGVPRDTRTNYHSGAPAVGPQFFENFENPQQSAAQPTIPSYNHGPVVEHTAWSRRGGPRANLAATAAHPAARGDGRLALGSGYLALGDDDPARQHQHRNGITARDGGKKPPNKTTKSPKAPKPDKTRSKFSFRALFSRSSKRNKNTTSAGAGAWQPLPAGNGRPSASAF